MSNEKLWPVRPNPEPDETFSSWICRLALRNGLSPRHFYVHALKWHDVWRRDFDLFDDVEKLAFLSRKTGKPLAVLTDMRLDEATLPVNHTGYLESHEFTHFCPMCIDEDKIPYFRRIWRSSQVAACERHGIFLHSRCAECHSPIRLLARDELIDLRHCGACQAPFARQIKTMPAPNHLLSYTRRIKSVFDGGWFELGKHGNVHPYLFFKGLPVLAEIACMHEVWTRVYDHAGFKDCFVKPFILYFHQRESFVDRCVFLLVLSWMLANWPRNFMWATSDLPRNATRYLAGKRDLPFWLGSVIQECFDIPGEEYRSREELLALTRLISAGVIKEGDFRRAFGRRYSLHLNGRYLTKFSNIRKEAVKLHASSHA